MKCPIYCASVDLNKRSYTIHGTYIEIEDCIVWDMTSLKILTSSVIG